MCVSSGLEHVGGVEHEAGGEECPEERGHIATPPCVGLRGRPQPFRSRRRRSGPALRIIVGRGRVCGLCLVSDNPPKTLAYVLHYSSFTPPSSGHKLYFVFHNRSSCQVPRNLKSLGNFRELGAIFLVFCVNR